MLKRMLLFIFLILSQICLPNVIKIVDKYNISEIKEIEYNSEEELYDKLKELLNNIYSKGYLLSSFEQDDKNLKLVPKIIGKVEYVDNSTKFLDFKRKIEGLNLENKIFNIKDIENIVKNFNKLKSNKLNTDIYINEQENKIDLKFINEYNPHFNISAVYLTSVLKDDKYDIYNVGLSKEQILGLNDKIKFNFSLLQEYVSLEGIYFINFMNKEFSIKHKYNKINNNDDIREYNKETSIKYKDEFKIKDEIIDTETELSYFNKKQFVRDIQIINNKFSEMKFNLSYNKIFNNMYVGNDLSLSNNFVIIDKLDDLVLKLENRSYINHKYFESSLDTNFSKSLMHKENEIDRYIFENKQGIGNYPLRLYKSNWQVILDNKIKYPIISTLGYFEPFVRVAVASSNNPKYNIGSSIGINYINKNFNIGSEYSIDKFRNRNLSFKFGLNFDIK